MQKTRNWRPLPRAADDVSIHPVEDGAILLSASTSRLVALNTSSAYLWCCLADGLSMRKATKAYATAFDRSEEEARSDIEHFLVSLNQYGLLAESVSVSSVTARDIVAPYAEKKPAIKSLQGVRHQFQILDTVFDVKFPTPELRDQILAVMERFEVRGTTSGEIVLVHIGVDTLDIEIDGTLMEHSLEDAEFVPSLKSALLVAAVNRTPFIGYLHAALLGVSDKAVLLPGASGSGKTCLSLALAKRGYEYLSDETAIIEPMTFRIFGVPLPACVKSDSWNLVSRLYPGLDKLNSFRRVDGKIVKYIDPLDLVESGVRSTRLSLPVASIIFPTYVADGGTWIEPMPRIEALTQLFANCHAWAEPLTPEFVDSMINWLSGIPCHSLTYSNLSEAADVFEKVVQDL